MSFAPPPAVKLAERLLLDVRRAVRGFSKADRFDIGADLKADSRAVVRLIHRAWRQRSRQMEWVEQAVWAVDDLKISLQLGSQLRAFSSLGQFEALAREARELGRQVGGWLRMLKHPTGQSVPAIEPGQRPQILSTHAASQHGANA